MVVTPIIPNRQRLGAMLGPALAGSIDTRHLAWGPGQRNLDLDLVQVVGPMLIRARHDMIAFSCIGAIG